MRSWAAIGAFATLIATTTRSGSAHIGSPDVFLDAQAGPYRVFVTVRPPYAIPGVADIEVLTSASDVRDVRIVPMPLTGPGARFAPVADAAERSRDDPRLFTGHLWMMTAGAWQVRVTVEGDQGRGVVSVPVPTLPQATLEMNRGLRAVLFALMLLLSAGFVSIVAALWRQGALDIGEAPGPRARVRGRIAGGVATCIVAAIVWMGNWWWSAEAGRYARYVYRPLQATTSVAADGRLTLALRDPGWIALRRTDDFIADHGHVMHLFVVSAELDRLWHLHPEQTGPGTFEKRLPDIPSGQYELFADLVHATGISETVTARIDLPPIHGLPLADDDSTWASHVASGLNRTGVVSDIPSDNQVSGLPDGGRMVWVRDGQPLRTRQLTVFSFRVDDGTGRPATDLELYMGMPGHAIFVSRDRRVFAHVHPSGSAPMAAMEIGERSLTEPGKAPAFAATPASELRRGKPPSDQDHMHAAGLPAMVSFPFGLPEPGDYRIFVQVKRAGRIDTGAFDARVEE